MPYLTDHGLESNNGAHNGTFSSPRVKVRDSSGRSARGKGAGRLHVRAMSNVCGGPDANGHLHEAIKIHQAADDWFILCFTFAVSV